jgi:hypothetical protein
MSTVLVAHSDLDGFYSAVLLARQFYDEVDSVMPVDYGKDYSYLKDRYDKFIICDFADNIGKEKTILWVDHHLRQTNGGKNQIIKPAPSCVRLLVESQVIEDDELTESMISNIDMVDSASFPFGQVFKPIDLVFPDPKDGEIQKYVTLNQLLNKNRKTDLFIELIMLNTLNVKVLLNAVDKSKSRKIKKYEKYMEAKSNLIDKIIKRQMVEYFDEIPVLFTKDFSKEDWIGFDKNIVAFLEKKAPYYIIVFDFKNGINIQLIVNPFVAAKRKVKSPASILEKDFDELRGHESILNFSFNDKEEAVKNLDLIINKMSVYL